MRRLHVAAAACLCAAVGIAQGTAEASRPGPPATLYVRVGRAWLSPSTAVEGAWLVVEDGILKKIEPKDGFTPPEGADVVEHPEGFALPTFVHAAATSLADASDAELGVTPTAYGADAFDPYAPAREFAASGVTRAFVSSGFARLVPGQGSVVRVNAVDPPAATLVRGAALRINFSEDVKGTPDVWEPPLLPGPGDPLPPARVQGPKTRAGAAAAVRALFRDAAAWKKAPRPFGEREPDLRPFAAALDKKLPVRFVADRAADVAAAIALAREFGLRLVIEGGAEAWRLAAELGELKAAVVLRTTDAPPTPYEPTAPLWKARGDAHPDAPGILKRAGVALALVPPLGAPDADLWFYATRALRNDDAFKAVDVLAATTWGAAAICGLPDADANPVGRPAEFAVFAGNPFETTARPALVVAEGRVLRRPKERKDLTAILAGRIHTCEGEVIRDGVIVVEKGKIRSVGRRAAIPPEARRVRADVVVPGFIDAGTQAGVRALQVTGEEMVQLAPPQPGAMDQPLSKWFEARMPAVRGAALAGVTTLALTPLGGRPTCGVIATVKTAGSGDRTVKAVSGILFDLGAGGPAGAGLRKQVETELERGKKYAESWTAYEKADREWAAKGAPAAAPAERKTLGDVRAPKAVDPVSGTWDGRLDTTVFPRPIPFTLRMKLDGRTVTGTASTSLRGGLERSFTGTFQDGVLNVTYEEGEMKASFKANVGRDVLNGTASVPGLGDGKFEATRIEKLGDAEGASTSRPATDSKPADGAASKKADPPAADDGRPKAPRVDPGLEPYRELFADRAAAYVIAPTERHGEIALDVFRTKFDLRTVMVSGAEDRFLLERYKAAGVAFLAGGGTARAEDDPRTHPAEAASRARIPTLLRTGPQGDPRGLYGLAERAVREGVDPEDALRFITRQPARFLGLLERTGSLDRGKDADLVFLSGEPFEAGTRVVRTMVDGAFVDEGSKP